MQNFCQKCVDVLLFLSQGLRVQETKEISPWEIIEGIKGSGPFQLSWFGAMRMKRKPLTYFEQRRKVMFHTHQHQYSRTSSQRHYVYLPEIPPADSIPSDSSPALASEPGANISQANQTKIASERAKILNTIRQMNDSTSSPVHPPGPLPPNFGRTSVGNIGHSQPTMSTVVGRGMVPHAVGGHVVAQAQPNPGMMRGGAHVGVSQQQQMQTWFDLMLREMTPEQRNHFGSLPVDQKRAYFMNYKRKIDMQRMYRYNRPMPMQAMGPGPMIHQQPRMIHRYSPHQMMPHPQAPGYMPMPPGQVHPQMFRQPGAMYGQGMPRHPGPPMNYPQ